MTMESKRAVIYARYSSSRQREESIERQIEICNDYAVAHNMLVICLLYTSDAADE